MKLKKCDEMIEGLEVKQLKVIKDERGFLMEILRSDDKFFEKFGQVYLSSCNPGYAKAWHYHKKQTDFFVIIKGNAKIVLYDLRENSPTKGELQEFIVGEENAMLIKIPPFVVHGYTALNNQPAFLLNCPTETYDYRQPDEYRLPFNTKEIPYDWRVDKGG
jgi:dTDP-4-dehydrorhamnose 3,5-epimerase